jgi:serine acetyltransferase
MGKFDGKKADKLAKIEVGDNVYFGMDSMVLPGVKIGDNVIVGARAVVTKNLPSNCVAVGMPARVISSIDDYYEKCKNKVHYTVKLSYAEKKAYYESIAYDGLVPVGESYEQ